MPPWNMGSESQRLVRGWFNAKMASLYGAYLPFLLGHKYKY